MAIRVEVGFGVGREQLVGHSWLVVNENSPGSIMPLSCLEKHCLDPIKIGVFRRVSPAVERVLLAVLLPDCVAHLNAGLPDVKIYDIPH